MSLFKNIHGWFCFLPPPFKYTFWGCEDICIFMERNWYILSFGINLHTRLVKNFLLIMNLFTSSDDRKFPRNGSMILEQANVRFLSTGKKKDVRQKHCLYWTLQGHVIPHFCHRMIPFIGTKLWQMRKSTQSENNQTNMAKNKQIWRTTKVDI